MASNATQIALASSSEGARVWLEYSSAWWCCSVAAVSLAHLGCRGLTKPGDANKAPSVSTEKLLATRHVMCMLLLAVALVVAMWLVGAIFDVVGCIAAAYVWILLVTQTKALEYPGGHIWQLAFAACIVAIVASPTVAYLLGCWGRIARVALWVVDVSICQSAYDITVRGYIFATGGMRGRVCLVTGSNRGIGYETAKALAKAGAVVVFACRNAVQAQEAMSRVVRECEGKVKEGQLIFMELDLASMSSIRNFAEEFYRSNLDLHVLCLSAGALVTKPQMTDELIDLGLASNHLGHFLLLQMLLPKILSTEQTGGPIPRIVLVSSSLVFEHSSSDLAKGVTFNTDDFDMLRHFGQAKLASMMCLRVLADRLKVQGSQVPAITVHPGQVARESSDSTIRSYCKPFVRLFLKTPQEGSMAILHACCSPSALKMSGEFLMRRAPVTPPAWVDGKASKEVWAASECLVGKHFRVNALESENCSD